MSDYTNVSTKIYFCSKTYPTSETGKTLFLDALRIAAHHGEDNLISGSGSGKRKREHHEYLLICQRGRNYSGNKFDKETNQVVPRTDYLKSTISNPKIQVPTWIRGKEGLTPNQYKHVPWVRPAQMPIQAIPVQGCNWVLCQNWIREPLPPIPPSPTKEPPNQTPKR